MGVITNKFLSAEILGTLVFTAFAIGTTWASLDSKVQSTDSSVKKLSDTQVVLIKDMSQIQADLAVIKNEQRHLARAIEEIRGQSREISKIRKLLEDAR